MIFGVSVVRDEADIVERVVSHMAAQVDALIVADNGSVDGTRGILRRLAQDLPLTVMDDPEQAWYQAQKMTALAHQAREMGAEFVVPFDADELWYARDGRIADVLAAMPPTIMLAEASLFDHRPTALDPEGDPVTRMGWRLSQALPMRKVACRCSPDLGIAQGNHAAGYASIKYPPAALDALVVRHFPYRTPDQFYSKIDNGATAYTATDLPESMGAHKRAYGRVLAQGGREALDEAFHRDFFSENPEADGLIYDPAP